MKLAMPAWADSMVQSSEFWAVLFAGAWGIGAFHGWFPGSFTIDLSSVGLGLTQIGPAWLAAYALVRIVKKTSTSGQVPFLSRLSPPSTPSKETPDA
jgi:hypothetical protein